jgi:DeoR family transcriptional regulator of aga operon
MDMLRASGNASVAELAAALEVTESTVRRTLQRLAEDGRIIRTYGGATLVEGGTQRVTDSEDPQIAFKRAIGIAASQLVEDGATIALSSGTTVVEMARRLRERHLTVITNALDIANVLLDAPDIELIVLGGVVLPEMRSMRGHLAEEALRDLRADTVYMGTSAIDLDTGFMTEQVREIAIDRAMRAIAREAVVLADASKFDRMAPGFMFGFERVGVLVTDERIRPDFVEAVESRGTRVVVGQEGGIGIDI